MKHLFIVNPVAGGRKRDPKGVCERIRAVMEPRGEDYLIYETAGPMDAAERVKREAVRGTSLRVYACGGDGTLSECVHGAAGFQNCAVAHYPCGTGNDFVRTFGEKNLPLFTDLTALVEGDPAPIDLMDVNGRKCVNIFSVGIDARVGCSVHKYSRIPLLGGKGAYGLSLAVNLVKGITSDMTVTLDEGVFEGKRTLVCACNGQYYGGGFHPVPEARPDDGILDILLVEPVSRFGAARCISAYANGEYAKHPEIIRHFQGRRLKVESEREFVINVDGEELRGKTASVRLQRQGVNFLCPRGFTPFCEE